MDSNNDFDSARDLELLLEAATGVILRDEDPDTFLDWMRRYAVSLAPKLFGMLNDDGGRRFLADALGRAIWNATPLPANRYRIRPLPKPERNAPCTCGSLRKYKHCCGALGVPELPLEPHHVLRAVLNHLPATQFAKIPHDQLRLDALAAVAHDWLENGDAERARKLLEPIFTELDQLDERAEQAFDVLTDCYTALNKPRKKRALVERVSHAHSARLRSAGLQRWCTLLADSGDMDETWRVFQLAQRTDPDSTSLGHLEVILLLTSGRRDHAVERARYWLARLRRGNHEDLDALVEFFSGIIAAPDQTLFDVSASVLPSQRAFADLVAAVQSQAPVNHYRVSVGDDGVGILVVDDTLAAIAAQWRDLDPPPKPALAYLHSDDIGAWEEPAATRWIGFLQRYPEAFDSFDILDDLVLYVHALRDAESPWIDTQLLAPLLNRAENILDLALGSYSGAPFHLIWAALDNRPALRLLANLVYLCGRCEDFARALALMERLVYVLNPNDNHGFRTELARYYVRMDRNEDMLALAARYPGDMFPALGFNESLALFRLGRVAEATEALNKACDTWPLVRKYLVAAQPRKPKAGANPYGITLGSAEEAWIYYENFQQYWREPAVFAWLTANGSAHARQQKLL